MVALRVVGHIIRDGRADGIPRARNMLASGMRRFEPFDRTAQFRESRDKSLSEMLATFADLRLESLAALIGMNLTENGLSRRGMHPELGEVTLGRLLATWVVHDLDHTAQVARTMAKAYAEVIEPGSAYQSILRDRRP